MKITIKDKEIELKYSIRALLMYENMTDRTLTQPSGLTDVITFMFCILVSSSKDYSLKFDDLIDYLDVNPSVISEFSQWLKDITENNEIFKKN